MKIEQFAWSRNNPACSKCHDPKKAVSDAGVCHKCNGRSVTFAEFVKGYASCEPDLDRLAIRNLFKVKGGTRDCGDLEKRKVAIKRDFEKVLPGDGRGYYVEGSDQILIVWGRGAMLFQP